MKILKTDYVRFSLILIVILITSEYSVMMLFESIEMNSILSKEGKAATDSLLLLMIASGPIFLWIVKPIIKKSKNYLHYLERITDAVENSGDAIIIMDLNGSISYVNKAFRITTGYSDTEVIGQNFRMLLPENQRGRLARMLMCSLSETGSWKGELASKHKDGQLTPQYLHLKYVSEEFSDTAYCIASARDITEVKRKEALLRQAQKMEAVGTLVGGVAHNFNNLLAGIIGKLYLAKKNTTHVEALNHLSDIESLSYDASSIIKQLLSFSHETSQRKQVLDIVPLVKSAVDTARLGVKEDIELISNFTNASYIVHCDSSEVKQVIINLINNARDAMDKEFREIRVTINQGSSSHETENHQKYGTEYVCIAVEDSGAGIDKESLRCIFNPFYTTKEIGKGTGLGLSSAKSTIESSGGFISVSSKVGVGTRFEVLLPVVHTALPVINEGVEVSFAEKTSTILIIDDDEMLRETLSQLLEDLGYKVLIAKNGKKGLEKFLKHIDEVELVISDVVMPVVNGPSAVAKMREAKPLIPVIFMSGSDVSHMLDNLLNTEEFIQKPFDVPKLSLKIYQLLFSHDQTAIHISSV